MEDRHFLSEPRPIKGLELPTWEVDILREGVDTPIMTIRVDNLTLPPRKRKKKVVWKLPDNFDQLPKFGTEDKKRILEIFKQQKKALKRQRKSSVTPSGETNGRLVREMDKTSKASSEPAATNNNHNNKKSPATNLAPPGFQKLSISEEGKEKQLSSSEQVNSNDYGRTRRRINGSTNGGPQNDAGPPDRSLDHLEPSDLPTTPPPGLTKTTTNTTNKPLQSTFENHQPPPPPGMQPQEPTLPTSMGVSTPSQATPTTHRQFIVPTNSNLAQVVMESYYLMLTRGMVQELASYYTPTAQKSLSVGGEHAVCRTVEERLVHLRSFVGCVMQIKGALQQPTLPPPATLIVITGTCIQPHGLPFCHSLILVPSSSPTSTTTSDGNISGNTTVGFRIQNDALCFLTPEQTPVQQPL